MSNKVPKEYQVSLFNCDEYLINGELNKWKGNTTPVYSSIVLEDKNGNDNKTLLGSIPDMETESALEALDAAKNAFNRGQGYWPTLKVGERLKCR